MGSFLLRILEDSEGDVVPSFLCRLPLVLLWFPARKLLRCGAMLRKEDPLSVMISMPRLLAAFLWLGSTSILDAQSDSLTKPYWLQPDRPLLSVIQPQRIQVVNIGKDDFPDIAAISPLAVELWENDTLGGYQRVSEGVDV